MMRYTGKHDEKKFLEQIMAQSGQNLMECLQCGKCSGGCPIASADVGGPRRLIAMILGGMKEKALKDSTWWYCVACGTCAVRCPVEINMYKVATALCEMAEHEGVKPSEPAIHLFEDLFIQSVRKNGRARELKTVMAYNLRTNPFRDMITGTKLMLKGAVSPFDIFRADRIHPEVGRIFERVEQSQKKEEPL